ncbi:Uncharacterized protein Fot_14008 [Forsythia ovata]|uniref:Uncharacterized protein n=1 Tax=Forsythia ovata TaxID=205694 RepID=A0ABD1W8M5_9LAMI
MAASEDLKQSHTTNVNVKSKKQKTNNNSEGIASEILNESNYSHDVYGLDDDLVFTEEDFKIMDESAEKNQINVNNVVAEAISPIPIDFEEDIPQEIPLKRLHKPSACLKSPYIRSFDSACNDAQEDLNMIFQYRFCMDPLDPTDVAIFKTWYARGLRLGNK